MKAKTVLTWMAIAVMGTGGSVVLGYAVGAWREQRSVEHGARLIAESDYASAARALLGAVAASPNDARAHYYLGLAYAGLGVRAGALSQLEEAVRLAPNEARFHAALGQSYRAAGVADRALVEFDAAVRLDPKNARYRVALVGVLLDQGRVADAVEHLRVTAQLQPESPNIRLLLAEATKGTGSLQEIARQYREVVGHAGAGAFGEIAGQEIRSTDAKPTTQEGDDRP